jgi:hypothetical protein
LLQQFFSTTKSQSPETTAQLGDPSTSKDDRSISERKAEDTDVTLQEEDSCSNGDNFSEEVSETRDDESRGSSAFSHLSDPAKWPTVISQCFRDEIVLQGSTNCPSDLKRFPVDESGRRFSATFFDKRLQNGEIVARKWLMYSPSVDKVFCYCCKLFEGDRCCSILGTTGMNDWKHLTQAKLWEHESSSAHCKNQHSWIECSTRLLQSSCVDAALQEQIRSEAIHWHGVLERLLDITLYLSGRGLAF